MSDWKEYKLGDAISFGNGKVRPNSIGLIPVYGGNGILNFCNDYNYEGENIIIGRVGAYCGAVYYENKPIWVSDNALAAKPKGNFNTKFLYYFLKNLELNQFAEGSSHPLVTQSLLNSIDVVITDDEKEQRTIASILSSLDDKIDLLHRQNKTLEQLAETLFRQWFVEEEKLEKEIKQLKELVAVIDNRGKTPFYSIIKTDYPIIEVKSLAAADRFVDYEACSKYITEDIYNAFFRDGHPELNDILFSTVGSIGEIAFVIENKGAIAQNIVALRANNISPFYLYQFLSLSIIKNKIMDLDIGAVQPSIKVPHLLEIEITIPVDKTSIVDFDKELTPIFHKMKINHFQIRTLTQLRDTLLPKLMSGEIRVTI